jgi:hypothetical protein
MRACVEVRGCSPCSCSCLTAARLTMATGSPKSLIAPRPPPRLPPGDLHTCIHGHAGEVHLSIYNADSPGVQGDTEGMGLGPGCEWKKVTVDRKPVNVEHGRFLVVVRPRQRPAKRSRHVGDWEAAQLLRSACMYITCRVASLGQKCWPSWF